MTNFRIDLLDPTTGDVAGSYPITTATQVTRQRALDRIGKWAFTFSATDPALADLEGKDLRVYWLQAGETRLLGECSYLRHQVDATGRAVQVEAAGRLRDLQQQTVLQRSFDGATDDVNDVLAEIVPLRSGWALGSVDTIANAAPLDFWYETIFGSVALLAQTFGYHFREGATAKTLDFGAFGDDSGVLALGGDGLAIPYNLVANPNLALVRSLRVAYQGDAVVNRLIPFGGAVGVATIDLSETTATQPGYAVQSAALPGGGSYYYIEDAASQATYGLIERRFLRKDLRPISNSPASREYAANILYEATLASLLNLKDRQTVYEVEIAHWTPGQVAVGDKIRLRYRGVAQTPVGEVVYADIDGATVGQGREFYVLEINETFGDGVAATLKINENAVHEQTVEDLLANTIRAFETAQVHVQPTISRYTVGPYTKRVSASPAVSASYSFQLGVETLNVWYVKIRLTGEPLKSSITATASDGSSSPTSGASSSSSSGASSSTTSGASNSTSSGSSSSTSSGSSSTSSSGSNASDHGHNISIFNTTTTVGYSPMYAGPSGGIFYYNSGGGSTKNAATATFKPDHTHNISHTHNIDHTHTIAHTHNIPHTHNIDHTHTVTIPTHSHGLTYGIYADTAYPSDLTIKLNGSTIASGVALTAGNNYTYELDITSNILAAATLQQEHAITVEAGSGRGEIQFQAQVLAVIQGIAVS